MGKINYLLIAFTLAFHLTSAQTDSVTVDYTIEFKEETDYYQGKKYKYFDRNFIEEKSLMKLGLSSTFSPGEGVNGFAEYEQKISKTHSLSGGISYGVPANSGINLKYKNFYSSKKKIRNNEKANNLNGAFVGLESQFNVFRNDRFWSQKHGNQFRAFWGIQNRLGPLGYLEFNAGVNYAPDRYYTYASSSEPKRISDRFNTYFSSKLALAIGNRSKNSQMPTPFSVKIRNQVNSITRQMDKDVTMIKMGFKRFNLSEQFYNINGVLGVEQKLIPALSILGEFEYNTYKNIDRQIALRDYSFNVGLKYYYSLNKRIESGLSANNFSANYIALIAKNISLHDRDYTNDVLVRSHYQNPSLSLLWGIQRKIGKFNYLDFNVGLKYDKDGIVPVTTLTFGFGW